MLRCRRPSSCDEVGQRHAHAVGDLLGGGRAAELALERLADGGEVTGARAQGARGEVEGADGVDDRAADAQHRPALERDALARVEAARRLDQAEGAGGDQLVAVAVARVVVGHAADDGADQGEAVGDQLVDVDAVVAVVWITVRSPVAAPALCRRDTEGFGRTPGTSHIVFSGRAASGATRRA